MIKNRMILILTALLFSIVAFSQTPDDDNQPKLLRDGFFLSGADGTAFHREIIKAGGIYLKAGGWTFMEIGAGQKDRVEYMLNESNLYDNIALRADYAGIERVSVARRVLTGG